MNILNRFKSKINIALETRGLKINDFFPNDENPKFHFLLHSILDRDSKKKELHEKK